MYKNGQWKLRENSPHFIHSLNKTKTTSYFLIIAIKVEEVETCPSHSRTTATTTSVLLNQPHNKNKYHLWKNLNLSWFLSNKIQKHSHDTTNKRWKFYTRLNSTISSFRSQLENLHFFTSTSVILTWPLIKINKWSINVGNRQWNDWNEMFFFWNSYF